MSSREQKYASITEGDIIQIIRNSLGEDGSGAVNESYVAQPKHYDMPAESVSTETKAAHKELYEAYVKSLNEVSAKLDTAPRKDAGHYSEFRALKFDESNLLNAVYLHELYFANCFNPSSEVYVDSLAHMRLQREWGNFDNWQRDFVACALSAREGWVVAGYHTFLKQYVNVVIDNHDGGVPVGLYPLVVVDMWSHSYRDFGNNRREYLITQMLELNWTVIEERFKRAEKIAEALR